MSRSSARIASKQPTKGDSDDDVPTPKQVPRSGNKSMNEQAASTCQNRTTKTIITTTSESSIEEFHDFNDEEEHVLPSPRKKLFPSSLKPSIDDEDDDDNELMMKPDEFAPSDDIYFARTKLDNLLAHISNGGEPIEEGIEDDYDSDGDLSPPAKSQRRTRPKKPRKCNEDGSHVKTPALVLKLFDRAVDLAKFCNMNRREVPLYPVCREWIRNQQEPVSSLLEPESVNGAKGVGFLHRLPEPLPIPDVYIENELSPRIPLSIVKPTIRKEDVDNVINTNMSHEQLMSDNMKRWKGTRNEWRESSKKNDSRYSHSCSVLKSMYEKSTLAEPMIEPKLEPLDN